MGARAHWSKGGAHSSYFSGFHFLGFLVEIILLQTSRSCLRFLAEFEMYEHTEVKLVCIKVHSFLGGNSLGFLVKAQTLTGF